MKLCIFFIASLPVWAQISAQVTSATTTQAVLRVKGYSGTCTIDLHKYDGNFNPQHPDWPNVADTTHSSTTTVVDGFKYIILGQSSAPLEANQQYFVNISVCGTLTVFFNTRPAEVGAVAPRPVPQDLSTYHKAGYPAINWTNTGNLNWYVDPQTGLRLRMVNAPEYFSYGDKSDQSFNRWAGATANWTNPANILNGNTSTAQTTGTTPIYLYATRHEPWVSNVVDIENIGVQVWGQCVTGTVGTDDCKIVMYVFDTPGTVPSGVTPIEIALGSSFAAVTSGASSYASTIASTNTFPSGYPRPHFNGWGSFLLTHKKRASPTTPAADTIVNGLVTISSPTINGKHFPLGLESGDHVWINGSGAAGCTAAGGTDICTVDVPINAGQTQLTELINLPANTTFQPLPWGVAIYKKTNVGEVRIGVKHRLAGGYHTNTGTTVAKCNKVGITRSDGVTGHSCVIPYGSANVWYFISDDGEQVVPIDGLQPALAGGFLSAVTFDDITPDVVYGTNVGGTTVYRVKYNGDWGVTPTVWQLDPPSGCKYAFNSGTDYSAATCSTPYTTTTAIITNIATKIAAFAPTQVIAPYSAWGGSLIGISGNLAFFGRVVFVPGQQSQDSGPCQFAVFRVDTNAVIDFINSTTDAGLITKFSECHSFEINRAIPWSIKMSANLSGVKATGNVVRILHGPHRMSIEGVLRGGTFDTADTSLPWPRDSTYDRACPSVGGGAGQIPQSYADVGAQNNNCVTMLVKGTSAAKVLCSEFGNNPANGGGDRIIYGACEWNADPQWSGGPALEVGMQFVDYVNYTPKGNGNPGDYEHFRVLTYSQEDSDSIRIVFQRNASREYCCSTSDTVSPSSIACTQNNGQLTHSNGWIAFAVPGTFGSCNEAAFLITYASDTSPSGRTVVEIPKSLTGHSGVGNDPNGKYSYIGTTSIRKLTDFTVDVSTQPPPQPLPHLSKFNNEDTSIGVLAQQYISKQQYAAPDHYLHFASDANHLNPPIGLSGNNFSNGLGADRAGDTFTPVGGFDDLWRIGIVGNEDVKNKQIYGWCGDNMLTDISSPTATGSPIDTAPEYSFCRAYKVNQCRTGSSVGQLWVKCPNVIKHSNATAANTPQTGMEFANTPVVISVQGGAGFIRTFNDQVPDSSGTNSRVVSTFLRPPGTHFPFWNAILHPKGQVLLTTSAGWAEGIRQVEWLVQVPKQPETNRRMGSFTYHPVQIGARTNGEIYARIKFGNNPSFKCNPNYNAVCYTDSVLTPYAFEDDSRTPTNCTSGCTIKVPAWPNELLWYVVETSADGVNFNGMPVAVVAP